MKTETRCVLACALAISAVTRAGAQTPPLQPAGGPIPPLSHSHEYGGPPLSLAAALEQAQEHNPDLAALRRQYDVVRQRPAQERFLAPPTFEAQVWQWPLNSVNPLDTNMYMFMGGQDIPGPGKRALRTRVLDTDVELSANEIAIRARQILDDVKHAYAEIFIARKAIDLHFASVELLRQLADLSETKYTTGRASQAEMLKTAVEVSRLHDEVFMFEEQEQLSSAALNTLMGRAPNLAIGPLDEVREAVLIPTVEALQALALDRQPELNAARLGVERARAELAAAKGEYKPDFSIQAGYMLMPRNMDAWTGRIGITWPNAPWSRGKLTARIGEANAAIDAATAQVAAAESRIRLAVQQAYIKVKTAEQRAALLRTTVLPQSRHSVEVARVAYESNRGDFLSLIDDERTSLNIQLDYYRALAAREQALADLERAVGADMKLDVLAPVARRGR
jgi:outer membrane protein TolC